ncbi:MAG: hypothetical protein V4676_01920 [Bacteroidota bacterium]
MLEHKRKIEQEQINNPRHQANKNFIETNCQGFEGMNYEQLRKPYIPGWVRSERDRLSGATGSPEQKK